ncbi:VOC family protein [Kordia sp.]|uniref:VOC family protein n=1 Tax=Kordia sp. TaxID=1965332 RepID=UPI003D6AABB9
MKINELTLFTTNLEAQQEFYTQVLEMPLVAASAGTFTIKVGASSLTFVKSERIYPAHFAIAISPNKIQQALEWTQQRTEILLCEGETVADFSNWNAEALYFYDIDGNIVEFISRKDTNNVSTDPFSTTDILSVCEIGIVSTHIETIYNQLNAMRPIAIYDGGFERFCAVGTSEGLFILVNNIKKKWFPTQEEAHPADFYIKGDYNFAFLNGTIVTEKA